MRHFNRMIGSESKRDGRAPIMTDDAKRVCPKWLCISIQMSFATVFLS